METKNLGPLRCRIVRKGAAREGNLTVVLLHGFGAPGDDLAGLADVIPFPDGSTLVFPEALHDMVDLAGPMYRGARAWWMIDMARLEVAINTGAIRDLTNEVPDGLAEARSAVIAMLDALDAKRLVLGGFSQGAMLSLDVALRDSKRNIEGLVLMSGTLVAEREWTPLMKARAGLPVFQSHGTADPILPYQIAEKLRDTLTREGLNVTFERFAGGHGIPPAVMARLGEWFSLLTSSDR